MDWIWTVRVLSALKINNESPLYLIFIVSARIPAGTISKQLELKHSRGRRFGMAGYLLNAIDKSSTPGADLAIWVGETPRRGAQLCTYSCNERRTVKLLVSLKKEYDLDHLGFFFRNSFARVAALIRSS